MTLRSLLLPITLSLLAATASADHPGEDLDARMTDKEQYFQAIDDTAPGFDLVDADGAAVRLEDYADKIVVLNFVYANCPDICPLHAEKMAEIQGMVNASPMRAMVQFLSITTDPANDGAEVLRDYADWHGLDPVNWRFLTAGPDQPEAITRDLAAEYGLQFTMTGDSPMQMHGAVMHVIDMDGRLAGKFHGMKFEPSNAALYVSELINNAQHRHEPEGISGWISGLF